MNENEKDNLEEFIKAGGRLYFGALMTPISGTFPKDYNSKDFTEVHKWTYYKILNKLNLNS